MIGPCNTHSWPDNVKALPSKPFKEVTIEAADGTALFIECNADEYAGRKIGAELCDLAMHPGPFKVGVATYRVKGDPSCLWTRLRKICTGQVSDNLPLLGIGVPPIIAAAILGVKVKACYSLRQRQRMANRREKMRAEKGGNLKAENAVDGVIVCTPDIRSDEAAKEHR